MARADYAAAVGRGVCDAGADVLATGMAGTQEMYWEVTEWVPAVRSW